MKIQKEGMQNGKKRTRKLDFRNFFLSYPAASKAVEEKGKMTEMEHD